MICGSCTYALTIINEDKYLYVTLFLWWVALYICLSQSVNLFHSRLGICQSYHPRPPYHRSGIDWGHGLGRDIWESDTQPAWRVTHWGASARTWHRHRRLFWLNKLCNTLVCRYMFIWLWFVHGNEISSLFSYHRCVGTEPVDTL